MPAPATTQGCLENLLSENSSKADRGEDIVTLTPFFLRRISRAFLTAVPLTGFLSLESDCLRTVPPQGLARNSTSCKLSDDHVELEASHVVPGRQQRLRTPHSLQRTSLRGGSEVLPPSPVTQRLQSPCLPHK